MRALRTLGVLTVVVGAFFVLASFALASPDATSRRVNCRLGDSHTWSNLGGDPVWKGGVRSVGQLGVVVRSASGQRSLTCLGLNQAQRRAVTAQIGNAQSCTMKWGQTFIAMAFHSDGASVDRPTRFVDNRFRAGARAFCLTATVKDGKSTTTIKLLWPEICVNAALVSQTTKKSPAKKPKVTKPKPAPTPGQGPQIVVCQDNQITIRDSNGVAIACQSQQQQQTTTVNVPVTVVVTTPPVVVTTPAVTLSPTCSAVLTADKSNRVVSLTAGGTASNGSTPTGASWVLSKNGAVVGTASGLSTTFAFADQLTTYNWTVVVQWSAGSATCSGSIQTGAAPPPLPGG